MINGQIREWTVFLVVLAVATAGGVIASAAAADLQVATNVSAANVANAATATPTMTPTVTPTETVTPTATKPASAANTTKQVNICHQTGSDSNSWVFITVDENAVPAHRAHGDIIGVQSAADCPHAAATTSTNSILPTLVQQVLNWLAGTKAAPSTEDASTAGKVTICHRTGSNKNPGVEITISRNALPAHLAQGDTMGACPQGFKAVPHGKRGSNDNGPGD